MRYRLSWAELRLGANRAMYRVLHILNDLSVGGTGQRVLRLALGLERTRYEVWAATLRDGEGASVAWPEHRQVSFSIGPGFHPGVIWRLARLIRARDFDIVHTHNGGPLLYGGLAAQLARPSVLIHGEHGRNASDWQGVSWSRQAVAATLARRAQRVVAVNEAIRQDVGRTWRLPESRIVVIPNGVDLTRFSPRPRQGSRPALVIGTVARFDRIKNLTCLIQGFDQLRQSDPHIEAQLILVGTGPQWAEVRARAAQSAYASDIAFPGETATPEQWYLQFDLFVNSSFSEGMSNAMLEAMACGLPVVASAIPGNRCWLRDGVNALFFESDNPTALSVRLSELALDPGLRHQMGTANRRLVEAEYDSRQFVRRYDEVYQQLLGR